MTKLILASGSPRRRELLSQALYIYEVIPSNAPEIVSETEPAKVVEALSRLKAKDIFKKYKGGLFTPDTEPAKEHAGKAETENFVVLGADTIVAMDDRIMGKPADEEEAFGMLKSLQGREHSVYTGVTLQGYIDGCEVSDTFYVRTKVKFFTLSDAEIRDYISKPEYKDKAGSYAIQGLGTLLVEKIDGDFNNVVGLPIATVHRHLQAMCGKNQIERKM